MRRPRTAALATAARLLALGVVVVLGLPARLTADGALSSLGTLLPPFLRLNAFELVKAGTATCEALPLDVMFAGASGLSLQTDVVEFTRSSRRSYRANRAHKKLRDLPSDSTIVVYIPGWWNTPADESSKALVDALLTQHPMVLLLDTRSSFCRGYVGSAMRVKPLADVLYSFIKRLHKDGVSLSSFHLVGFSLGAHVAGLAGSLVKSRLNGPVGRITALDPAKPCFTRPGYRLQRTDATFVHVIHSSAGVLGMEEPVGHADVYINGVEGRHPECEGEAISLECDHAQAWKMYAASVIDKHSFVGHNCRDWEELVRETCGEEEVVVGHSADSSLRGLFLYKSKSVKRNDTKLQVFNPLEFLVRWQY